MAQLHALNALRTTDGRSFVIAKIFLAIAIGSLSAMYKARMDLKVKLDLSSTLRMCVRRYIPCSAKIASHMPTHTPTEPHIQVALDLGLQCRTRINLGAHGPIWAPMQSPWGPMWAPGPPQDPMQKPMQRFVACARVIFRQSTPRCRTCISHRLPCSNSCTDLL